MRVFRPDHSAAQLEQILRERVGALAGRLSLKRAVLFGSWARGKATAFSDIDLLVVYADPPRADAYTLVWRSLDLRGVQPHVYSENEAAQHARSLDRMTKDGIVLFP